MKSAIQKAVEAIGSQSALARKLDVTPQCVQQWVRSGKVPAERVLEIEFATAGAVSRFELRPDIYPIVNADRRNTDKDKVDA